MIDKQSLNYINKIEPVLVESYLRLNQWHHQGEIPNGKASIWEKESENQIFSLMLPLSQELRDFSARICELIEILEIVEKRSATDIILNLINQNVIAQEIKREILMFRFSFVSQNNLTYREMPIQQIGAMLTSLQTLFYAIGQYKSYQNLNDVSNNPSCYSLPAQRV